MNLLLSGLRAYAWQRISAVYMLLFLLYAVLALLVRTPMSYEQWRDWLTSPLTSAATVLFFFMLLAHLWVGMRNVFMDYIHPLGVRTTLLALLALAVVGHAIWVLRIFW